MPKEYKCMVSLTEFFYHDNGDNLKGISHKNSLLKRNIIAYMAVNGECTLSELTKELHISVPTMTKLVQELVDDNIVLDLGKVETPGGRRPNIFGLANTAIYFAGITIARDFMGYVITDLILVDSNWPPLASLIWIILFWVYVILDACMTMGKIKTHRREKKAAAAIAKNDSKKSPEDATWEEIVENTTGKIDEAYQKTQEKKK